MNYIDVKVTVWNRLKFSDDADMQQLTELVKEQGIESVIDESLGFGESETLYETEERLEPEDNAGQSTIEIYKDDNLLWENSSNFTAPGI